MNQIVKLLLISAILLSSACSTIHFDNGEVIPDPEPFSWTFGFFEDEDLRSLDASTSIRYRKWYHHGFYRIAEISNPLETSRVCLGLEWNRITTEVTVFDGIISLVDNAMFHASSSMGIDLWSPWSIEYSCRNYR